MFVTRKWAPAVGGMETYSMRLTEALREIEPVDIVALPGQADGMPPTAAALMFFPVRVLVAMFRRGRFPRVLHLGDMALWPLGVLPCLFLAKTRIVLSAHGTDVAYHRRGGLKGRLYGAYLKLGARLLRGAKVIANSRATAEVARETGWRESTIIPLATDLRGTDLRGDAPAARHNGRLLFVGRLVERKGCGWFIRNVLPLLDPAITLDVAGTGWDDDEIAALDNPRVRHLGSLHGPALVHAYAEALAVIVPNIETATGEYEGFGLVAPEAAACGGVVIASRSGGLTDAVLEGETGLLVTAGDASQWQAALCDVGNWSGARRREFTAAAQDRAHAHFSWGRAARETLDAYCCKPIAVKVKS